MSNRAMLMRRHGNTNWSTYWPKFEREQTKWRDHMFASGGAWNYSRRNKQVIHNGSKP